MNVQFLWSQSVWFQLYRWWVVCVWRMDQTWKAKMIPWIYWLDKLMVSTKTGDNHIWTNEMLAVESQRDSHCVAAKMLLGVMNAFYKRPITGISHEDSLTQAQSPSFSISKPQNHQKQHQTIISITSWVCSNSWTNKTLWPMAAWLVFLFQPVTSPLARTCTEPAQNLRRCTLQLQQQLRTSLEFQLLGVRLLEVHQSASASSCYWLLMFFWVMFWRWSFLFLLPGWWGAVNKSSTLNWRPNIKLRIHRTPRFTNENNTSFHVQYDSPNYAPHFPLSPSSGIAESANKTKSSGNSFRSSSKGSPPAAGQCLGIGFLKWTRCKSLLLQIYRSSNMTFDIANFPNLSPREATDPQPSAPTTLPRSAARAAHGAPAPAAARWLRWAHRTRPTDGAEHGASKQRLRAAKLPGAT